MADSTYDVFLSYSRADARHAAEIDSVLRDKGLKTFFDRRNLAAGLPWVRALEQAIGAAKAVIVLIGPRGLGNTQQYERELAFVRQTRDSAFPIVPVILPETTTEPPFDFLRVLTWIDFSHVTRVSNAPDVVEQLLRAIHGQPTSAETAREAICPYRGLDAFREEDAAFFFGRGSADDPNSPIGELVSKVREHPFVMVVGRSGSGKSSLVYAGLLPALRRERDRFWNALSLRPGPTPLRALAAAFNPREDDEGAAEYAKRITKEADELRTGDAELLSHMIREELGQAEGNPDQLLLYIDQWEELYAQAPPSSDKERAAQHAADVNRFIDLLLTASRTAPVAVVGTVRADFYDPLIGHQQIKSLLPTRQVLLGKMLRSELEQTIVEPAKRVELIFDPPSLVQRILDEAGEDEGMLPLLQYALKETWARRQGNRLTEDSYTRSGGVREAIRITAERTFDALSPDDQQVARQLFLRLVTPGEGQEDTRARAAMPVDQAQRKIVEQFASQRTRLLVTGFDRAARPTVEVAHEALIRTWPRLRQWIDSNREKLRSRAAILQAKTDWEKSDRRDDMLLPAGLQLERARSLLADPGDIGTDDINEFILLSSAREEADRAAKEKQLQFQRRVSIGALAAALLLAIFGGLAWFQWGEAARSERRADAELKKAQTTQSLFLADLARQRRSAGDAGTGALLALEALPDKTTGVPRVYVPEAEVQLDKASRDLRERFVLQFFLKGRRVLSAAFSPEGKRIVTASSDKTARLRDAETGKPIGEPLIGHEAEVRSATFSPDGKRIVTASWDRTARLWDAETGRPIGTPLTGHTGGVNSAAFSPDGKRIVTASSDMTARLWDAETGKPIGELDGHEGWVWRAAFSPDGKRIVTASGDQTARLWDADTGKAIGEPLRGHSNAVSSAAFSPDGKRIVTSSSDTTARLWDAETGKPGSEPLRGHADVVLSAAFSLDGKRIVTASRDTTARLWDAETGKPIGEPLGGHEGWVSSAVFSPDGMRVVTASWDTTARLWDAETGKPLRGHEGLVVSAAFSPDGRRIVTASGDQTARLWDADTGKAIGEPLRGHASDVSSAAFSPEGKRIVTASSDKTARLWDAETGRPISEPLIGHEAKVQSATFSPDGKRIVTASDDKTARLWDAETGRPISEPLGGHEGWVSSAVFSPDGKRIVTASSDKTARLWDAETGRPISEPLTGHEAKVQSATFSPDGKRIVTASDDKTARLWDAETGRPISEPLGGHEGWVSSAVFSPDGKRIVTASSDKTARLWDAETGKPVSEPLRGHEGFVLSAAFSPDGKRIVTASEDQTARLWDADTGKAIGELDGHKGWVWRAAFSPDGKRIVTASWDTTARVWEVFANTQELVSHAKSAIPRCLTRVQRKAFFLAPEPPFWCIELEKWPYDTDAWKQWLSDTRAGKSPPLPAAE